MIQSGPDNRITKITLLAVSTLTVMAVATIAPALPAMRAAFAEVPNVDLIVRLVLTIPGLFIVMGAPVAGVIVDKYGRKRLLVVSTVLYGVAGSSGFVFDSLTGLLIGRALLGIAVAGIMISVTTLIADYYQGQARAKFMGMQAAFMNLGGVVFTAAGGFLADVTWQTPFLIYLIALVMVPFAMVALFEPKRQAVAQDDGATDQAGSGFPFNRLVIVYITAFIMMTVFMMMAVQLPFLLEVVAGASATQSGLALSGGIVFSIPPSLLYARIRTHLEIPTIVAIGFGLFGVGYAVIGFADGFGQMFAGAAVAGIGLGLLMPTFNIWLAERTPARYLGRAFGLLTTFIFFGQFVSPFVTQPLSQQVGLGMSFTVVGVAMLAIGMGYFIGGRLIPAMRSTARMQQR